MTTLAKIIITSFLALLCFSCNIPFEGVRGEGQVITKEKELTSSFTAIKTGKGLEVILTESNDRKVIIKANENLHDIIEVYVENDILYVTSKKNIYTVDAKTVQVSYQKLNRIDASSGSDVTSMQPIVQKDLEIEASSGAKIDLTIKSDDFSSSASSGAVVNLSGKVSKHTSSASSGAVLKAKDLLSLYTNAKVSSGATIKLHAKDEFVGKATSGGIIDYYGQPERVDESENSGGNIKRI